MIVQDIPVKIGSRLLDGGDRIIEYWKLSIFKPISYLEKILCFSDKLTSVCPDVDWRSPHLVLDQPVEVSLPIWSKLPFPFQFFPTK